jgi:hypothetical protein
MCNRRKTWISTDDKLPDVNEDVLVTLHYGEITIAYRYDDNEWHSDKFETFENHEILAWQKCPKPYKKEK